jgi:hypothetical protein
MMDELRIELEEGRTCFRPGERIRSDAVWRREEPAEGLEVRLFWYTQGKGERDVDIIETTSLATGSREGRSDFSFKAPPAPLSFSGKLISLIWAIELVALPSGEAARQEIVLSHTGEELRIGPVDDKGVESGAGGFS